MFILFCFLDIDKMVVNEEERNGYEWGRCFKDKKLGIYFVRQRKFKREMDSLESFIFLDIQSILNLESLRQNGI